MLSLKGYQELRDMLEAGEITADVFKQRREIVLKHNSKILADVFNKHKDRMSFLGHNYNQFSSNKLFNFYSFRDHVWEEQFAQVMYLYLFLRFLQEETQGQ